MKDNERIDYLIKTLAGNNARKFAAKTGIRTDTLSRARNGLAGASQLYTAILTAYPEVRRKWLVEGEGEPFRDGEEKGEILRKLDALEREVRRLTKAVEALSYGMIKKENNP